MSLTYCSLPLGNVGETELGIEERVECDHNFCFQYFPEEICTTISVEREAAGVLGLHQCS